MKRDDAIAADLSRGVLSPDEQVLDESPGPEIEHGSREWHETWLYEHLTTAARARVRMDSAKSWSVQYHEDFRARENAIAKACDHYRALREMGEIEPLLAQMALTEGLNR